jgi:hypothetical protein
LLPEMLKTAADVSREAKKTAIVSAPRCRD